MNGRDLTLGLVGALALGAVLGRRGSRATDPTFRVRSPAEGHRLIASKVYTDNWKKALAVTPTHREAVLVPCAGTKPFSSAPSHAHGYVPGLEGRAVDRYVVAEPLGIVPWAWEDTYPNNAYDFPPDQLRGKGRDLLVERIRAWFTEGPGRSYDRIWLALPGHHGRLVADATRDLSLPTEDVSITACRAAKACGTSVHRATSKAYVRYLKKTVVPGGARGSRSHTAEMWSPKPAILLQEEVQPGFWVRVQLLDYTTERDIAAFLLRTPDADTSTQDENDESVLGAVLAHNDLSSYNTTHKSRPGTSDLVPACAGVLPALKEKGVRGLYVVEKTELNDRLHGRGLGMAMYDALVRAAWQDRYAVSPHWCAPDGHVSSEARRVWSKLARRYPHVGDPDYMRAEEDDHDPEALAQAGTPLIVWGGSGSPNRAPTDPRISFNRGPR